MKLDKINEWHNFLTKVKDYRLPLPMNKEEKKCLNEILKKGHLLQNQLYVIYQFEREEDRIKRLSRTLNCQKSVMSDVLEYLDSLKQFQLEDIKNEKARKLKCRK